jgi:hypothetical protein
MKEILGVVSKEEFLEMEKKIEKTLGQVVYNTIPDAGHLTSHSLLAKQDKRNICVEQIMIGDVKDSVNLEKFKSGRESQRRPLDIAEVEKILSLVTQLKTLYAHEVEQSKENIKPVFFRARARAGSSSGLNP